ncbi:uncharacterized protein LOC129747839 isoform X2 [Uranotaenia lowii]|nr:uncharacterized protein LOC129747839 isoform X2 [Uranotaenia lowii]XP_055598178.1 uncharacterized protein LOC129747839 isoform X2 [Uranotaenia lowii]
MENLLNQGPIQFPQIVDSDAMNALPHPYERFALKERAGKTERFSGADNLIVKPAYRALAKHAAKVLNRQLAKSLDDEDEIDNYNEATNVQNQYAFSYAVKDAASGDDFSHSQQQQVDGAVKGSYKVHLPDGRMQIVKYIADNNGYRADVTYENEPNSNLINHAVTAAPEEVQVPASAVPVVSPLASAQPIYNYYKNLHQRQQYIQQPALIQQQHQPQQQVIYYPQTGPTQIPAPYYPARLRVNDVKIHSYNTAPHANTLIRSTLAPNGRAAYIALHPSANLAYVSSTPNPSAQIQSNALNQAGLIPVIVTTARPTAIPYYHRDIHVTPAPLGPRRTTIYNNGPGQQRLYAQQIAAPIQANNNQEQAYQYVQIPASNHVYKRNTDKDSKVVKSSADVEQKKPTKVAS